MAALSACKEKGVHFHKGLTPIERKRRGIRASAPHPRLLKGQAPLMGERPIRVPVTICII